jgi:hypothetical protein
MPPNKITLREILRLLLIVFDISALWEIVQTPLYVSTTILFGDTVSSLSNSRYWLILLLATLGDVMYIGCIYLVITLVERNFSWIKHPLRSHSIFLIILIGLMLATGIEWRGLSEGRWIYSMAMPIVPYIGVGLSPFVQLSTTAIITIVLFRRYIFKYSKNLN